MLSSSCIVHMLVVFDNNQKGRTCGTHPLDMKELRKWIDHMLAAIETRTLCAYGCEAPNEHWIKHMLAALEKRPLCANVYEANQEKLDQTCVGCT